MSKNNDDKRSGISPLIQHFDDLPNSAYVPLNVICVMFGCSPATAWRRVKSGQLIAPQHFGSSTRWNVGEIRQALRGRANFRSIVKFRSK